MANDYFLKIDGIAGESQDARRKGEIVLMPGRSEERLKEWLEERFKESHRGLYGQAASSSEDSTRRTFSLRRKSAKPHQSSLRPAPRVRV